MDSLPSNDDLKEFPDSPSTLSYCQAFQTLPHQNQMQNEELSSIDDDLSDAESSEHVVEYAVLLPDSFVVLDHKTYF